MVSRRGFLGACAAVPLALYITKDVHPLFPQYSIYMGAGGRRFIKGKALERLEVGSFVTHGKGGFRMVSEGTHAYEYTAMDKFIGIAAKTVDRGETLPVMIYGEYP